MDLWFVDPRIIICEIKREISIPQSAAFESFKLLCLSYYFNASFKNILRVTSGRNLLVGSTNNTE